MEFFVFMKTVVLKIERVGKITNKKVRLIAFICNLYATNFFVGQSLDRLL